MQTSGVTQSETCQLNHGETAGESVGAQIKMDRGSVEADSYPVPFVCTALTEG